MSENLSENRDDTTSLEYLITGLAILFFGLLYFLINHGTSLWPGSAAQDFANLPNASLHASPTSSSLSGIQLAVAPTKVETTLTTQALTPPTTTVTTATTASADTRDNTKQTEGVRLTTADETRTQAEPKQPKTEEQASQPINLEQPKQQEAAGTQPVTQPVLVQTAPQTGMTPTAAPPNDEEALLQAEVERTDFDLPDGSTVKIGEGFEDELKQALLTQNTHTPLTFDKLVFDTGSSTLTPASKNQLKAVAALLYTYQGNTILIRGHTDNIGSAADNSLLSLMRSDSVKNELITLGVDPERLQIEGVGQLEPIAPNDTEAGRQKNRRIELLLVE